MGGLRGVKAFGDGNCFRGNNVGDSPDITALNFNVVRNKTKTKKL